MNDHRRVGGSSKLTRSEIRETRKRDSIWRMWIEKERENERKKDVEGGRGRHETFPRTSCSKKQDRLKPASLNVTQAAVHKERWRESNTHKKKYLFPHSVEQCSRWLTDFFLLKIQSSYYRITLQNFSHCTKRISLSFCNGLHFIFLERDSIKDNKVVTV